MNKSLINIIIVTIISLSIATILYSTIEPSINTNNDQYEFDENINPNEEKRIQEKPIENKETNQPQKEEKK
jgi:hypothetical protein